MVEQRKNMAEFLDASGSEVADPGRIGGDLGPNSAREISFENNVPGHGPIPTDLEAAEQGMLNDEDVTQGIPTPDVVPEPEPEPEPAEPLAPEGEEAAPTGEGEPEGEEPTAEEVAELYELLEDGQFNVTEGGKSGPVSGKALADAYRHRAEQDRRYADLKAKEAGLDQEVNLRAANALRRMGVIDDNGQIAPKYQNAAPGAAPAVPAEPDPDDLDYDMPVIDMEGVDPSDLVDPVSYKQQNALAEALSRVLKAQGSQMKDLRGQVGEMREASANVQRQAQVDQVKQRLETILAERPVFAHEGRRDDGRTRVLQLLKNDQTGLATVESAVDAVENYFVNSLGVVTQPAPAAPAVPVPGMTGGEKTLKGKRPPVVGQAGRQNLGTAPPPKKRFALGSQGQLEEITKRLNSFLPGG